MCRCVCMLILQREDQEDDEGQLCVFSTGCRSSVHLNLTVITLIGTLLSVVMGRKQNKEPGILLNFANSLKP